MSRAGCWYCGLPLRLSQHGESHFCTRFCEQKYKSSDPRGTELRSGVSVNAGTPGLADKTRQAISEGATVPEGGRRGVSSAVGFLLSPLRKLSSCVPTEQDVHDTPGLDKPGHPDAIASGGSGSGAAAFIRGSDQQSSPPATQASKSTSAEGNA